jgi:hypothetical protein
VPITEVPLLLTETEFERSGGLKTARRLINLREWIFGGMYLTVISVVLSPGVLLLAIVYMVVQHRGFRGYRQWTLEMLAIATAQLLGPEEPMVAGETACRATVGFWPGMQRDFAIAATKAHVVLYQIEHYDFPLSRVVFAARTTEVEITAANGFFDQHLVVTYAGRRWVIRGVWGVFKGDEVLQAWWNSRQKLVGATATT